MRTRQEKLDYLKSYREKHRVRIAVQKKAWYEKNKKKLSPKYRQYYLDNRETTIKRAKIWAESNPEKRREIKKRWNERNRDYFANWKRENPTWEKEWRKANPHKTRQYRHRRRALLKNTRSEEYTLEQIYIKDEGICQLCFVKVEISKGLPVNLTPTVDHIIPISKGGDNTLANVQLAHYGCNSRKGNRI